MDSFIPIPEDHRVRERRWLYRGTSEHSIVIVNIPRLIRGQGFTGATTRLETPPEFTFTDIDMQYAAHFLTGMRHEYSHPHKQAVLGGVPMWPVLLRIDAAKYQDRLWFGSHEGVVIRGPVDFQDVRVIYSRLHEEFTEHIDDACSYGEEEGRAYITHEISTLPKHLEAHMRAFDISSESSLEDRDHPEHLDDLAFLQVSAYGMKLQSRAEHDRNKETVIDATEKLYRFLRGENIG